ncbi:DUF488 family protein [Desulfomicrobium orale]|uniref:DUF488 domain-containing protein n=1 Tax=Desulfomicrobium orale TaxID=132132 RepID=UPI0009FADFA2|nr:DUF488 domain-containing protein [Desulfomicrobium orale]
MNIYTIGFTKKNAETFFRLIKSAKIAKLIDIRLNADSQLAGFAKKNDLRFFLHEICGTEYFYFPEFAPTKDILEDYKKNRISWEKYEVRYLELIEKRKPIKKILPEFFENSCLLCSEHEPINCHRRLAAEYVNMSFNGIFKINHLY